MGNILWIEKRREHRGMVGFEVVPRVLGRGTTSYRFGVVPCPGLSSLALLLSYPSCGLQMIFWDDFGYSGSHRVSMPVFGALGAP